MLRSSGGKIVHDENGEGGVERSGLRQLKHDEQRECSHALILQNSQLWGGGKTYNIKA